MNVPARDLLAALTVARRNGTVDEAITAAGKTAIVEAEALEYLRVVHDRNGVVGAHWATERASYVQQRNDLHLELTDEGSNRLTEAGR